MPITQHTPGPWRMEPDSHERGRILSSHGAWIATTWRTNGDGNDSAELPALANAKLIAAAPELLDALQAIANDCRRFLGEDEDEDEDDLAGISSDELLCAFMGVAETAIAKAMGQS